MSEAKVLADDHLSRANLVDQRDTHELRRRQVRELPVEANDNGQVEPVIVEERESLFDRREDARRANGCDHLHRVRLERHDRGAAAETLCFGGDALEEDDVSPMHAVEHADRRDGRVVDGRSRVGPPQNFHAASVPEP